MLKMIANRKTKEISEEIEKLETMGKVKYLGSEINENMLIVFIGYKPFGNKKRA